LLFWDFEVRQEVQVIVTNLHLEIQGIKLKWILFRNGIW